MSWNKQLQHQPKRRQAIKNTTSTTPNHHPWSLMSTMHIAMTFKTYKQHCVLCLQQQHSPQHLYWILSFLETTITMTSTIAAAKLDAQRSISSMSTHSNDSYLLQRANGVNGIYDRGRSPSPTEFFRTKLENYNHIWIREHELNEFIQYR